MLFVFSWALREGRRRRRSGFHAAAWARLLPGRLSLGLHLGFAELARLGSGL